MNTFTLLQLSEHVAAKSADMAAKDPHGAIITLVSVSMVFIALIILYFAYTFIGKILSGELKLTLPKRRRKTADKSGQPEEEVAAAIALALDQELNGETYQPNCCTALYDAMGKSLSILRKKVAADDKVLVTIVTDGCENASYEYSGAAIKALVDELKAAGWVFAYIGANHNVEAFAAQISITNVMQFHADSVGTQMMSQRTNDARTRMYDRIADGCCCAADENENFFKES